MSSRVVDLLFKKGLAGGAAPNPLLAGVVCPAITPTIGNEALPNPGFEGTYDDESGGNGGTINVAPNFNQYNCVLTGADTLDKNTDVTYIKAGSASQKAIMSAAAHGLNTDNIALTVGTWYQILLSIWPVSGAVNLTNGAARIAFSKTPAGTGAWKDLVLTARCKSTGNDQMLIRSSGGAATFYLDSASYKPITFTTMRSLLGTTAAKDGTYKCHPTVADGTAAGILIEYLDDNNFCLMIVDRSGNSAAATLLSRIAGTYAEARTGTITYVAAQELKVIVSGTTHALYYNGTQVGADVAITNTGMGLQVHGFNAYAGNTVGTVTANP